MHCSSFILTLNSFLLFWKLPVLKFLLRLFSMFNACSFSKNYRSVRRAPVSQVVRGMLTCLEPELFLLIMFHNM
jgi:hypothetical protein